MPIKSQLCKDVWWQSRLPKSVKNIDDMNPEHVELAGTSGFTTSPTDTALTSKNKACFQDVLAEIPKDETQNHIAVSDTEDGLSQAPSDKPYDGDEEDDTLYESDSDTGGGFVHGETAGAVASGPTSGGAVSGSVADGSQGSTSSFCGLTGCTSAAQSSNKNGSSAFAVSSSATFSDGSTISITSRLKKWFYV
ncbi:uncharacterized protein PG998_010269 [Apiospora kogelbergensis]|uniref:Uncharacterized protein n=1 Tax=Apiospora kogelbergensis TaxID=1337665 RepID=A0AAW0RA88_9PEZI